MKKSMAGLNGRAIKLFFLAHFEKMIFGVCLIIAIWACFQNRWGGYDQYPQDLTAKVDETTRVLRESDWPEAERKSITSYRFIEQAQKVAQTSNWEKFAIERLYWPLYPRKMQASEPEWMQVEDLKVDAGQALIALKSKTPEADVGKQGLAVAGAAPKGTPAASKDGKTTAGGSLDAPAQPGTVSLPGIGETTKGGGGAAAGGAAAATPGGLGANPFPGGLTLGNMGGGFGGGAGAPRVSRRSRKDDDDSAGAGGADGGAATPAITIQGDDGRGYRFAAVRGVFPLQQQLLSFVRAHLAESEAAAGPIFNPFEFQVERQEAIPGDDPWSGKWQRLDLENSIKLLKEEVSGLEPEAVDQKYIDYTIAMPVPLRVFGTWNKDLLTHPAIEQLNEQQLEEQRKHQEEQLKQQKNVEKEQQITSRRKGFSEVAHNPRVLQQVQQNQQVQNNEPQGGFNLTGVQMPVVQEVDEKEAARIARRTGRVANPAGLNPGANVPGQLQAVVTAKVLLFRYFDFDVEPGRTYRYRVRLVVENPSFSKNLAEVTEPFVAEGETRETPWSAPTEPVKIPDDYQLYLLLVSDKGPGNQRVAFKIYEWEPSIGTRVLGEIRKVEFGQVVGGLSKTPVLRLTKKTLQDEQVELRTRDVLLDVRESPTIIPSEHPDLEFADVKNAGKPVKMSVPSSAVIGNQFGEMEVKDQEAGKEGLKSAETEAAMVNKFFDYLKANKDKLKTGDSAEGANVFKRGSGKKRDR